LRPCSFSSLIVDTVVPITFAININYSSCSSRSLA
jgi:hypothetical protein